jgi:AraC family transcriptional regulator of adaptative response/methylated-DNA-[protein]-cysteine methyltransferase
MNSDKQQRAAATLGDPRWAAVQARDPAADGRFFYSVRSTGVYCRPSCASRPARPDNVAFHATSADAEGAGFRPCQRCRPDQPPLAERQAALVAELCRWLDAAEQPPSLQELAEHAGLSRYHLHRLFKAVTGLTPRAYAAARRAERLRSELRAGSPVTEAIYAAGYNANSRCYAEAGQVLGMTPKRYRAGGSDTVIRFATSHCTLGALLVAASERGICAILLGDAPAALVEELRQRLPRAELRPGDADFAAQVAAVVAFVDAPRLGLALPLDLRGTAFQQRVWQALQQIPPGQTLSYSALAARIGTPKAVRAVASACAANALAVAVPCHRAVRNDGGLAGYRWGIERKQALLEREAEE